MIKDRATQHALDVLNGNTPFKYGRLHKLACKRHIDDLKKQNRDDFPFYWDEAAAERIINFAETLTIAEGSEPEQVKLFGFQCFDFGVTMGWKIKKTGYRRFRRRYISIARQQGKTFSNGIMASYISGFSGYNYGKLFTVATRKRQSRLAWEETKKFIEIDPDLAELYKIKDYNSYIECLDTHCTVEALSQEAGLQDGFRAIYASVDELHQHRNNGIYKSLWNGTRSLPETLLSMISTRGDNIHSFAKDMDDYCIKILEGMATAENMFVDIYCPDAGDDIWKESTWAKANPFTFSMVFEREKEDLLETLRQDAQTSKDMGGDDLKDFMIKSLNLWFENSDRTFIKTDHWKQCATDKTLEDFKGKDCYIGIDLSSGGDITSWNIEIPHDILTDGGQIKKKYFFFQHSYIPRGRFQEHLETDLAPYDLWEQMGLLTVTGGEMDFKNDYKFIINDLKEVIGKYNLHVKGIGADPHNLDGFIGDLEVFGVPVISITQSARFLNDTTTDFQLLARGADIEYNKNDELMTWCILNAQTVKNSFEEIKIDKRKEKNGRFHRIDVADAMIDSHCVYLKGVDSGPAPVNTDDSMNDYFKMMGW